MKSRKISAVINTLNEEKNIANCIRSLNGFADEIVVCDMYSTDKTVKIAGSLGAKVVFFERTKSWTGEPRKFAITQAINEWILMIDADERLTPPLAEQLQIVAVNGEYECVVFAKLNYYFAGYTRYGGFYEPFYPLFFKKKIYLDNYTGIENKLHNDYAGLYKVEKKLILPNQYHLIHLAYPTIEKYVCKTIGMYARMEAQQMHVSGERFSLMSMIVGPVRCFTERFIFKKGYRDGMRGYILAVLYAVYRFCIWANLWMLEQKVSGHNDVQD